MTPTTPKSPTGTPAATPAKSSTGSPEQGRPDSPQTLTSEDLAPRPDGTTDPMLALRVVPMPRDTNAYGTIFGGVIMSYIDQAGLVEAIRHAPCPWVTASIERIDFAAPVQLGDIVSLYSRTERVGRSSIRVAVEVEATRRETRETCRVTTAVLTMVAVGPDGRPTPFRDPPAE
ncbi:MAG: acyl-CoA thioesterase [Planctomycetota bacterium]